ncbi:hypothetical protein V1514DRAFT_330434 [Lipomyces japonicus]|uniref:uncharacterized protein n=1 Tax=Lipomyces japonicus TaxID=56871 RepID=UPI0034CF54BA
MISKTKKYIGTIMALPLIVTLIYILRPFEIFQSLSIYFYYVLNCFFSFLPLSSVKSLRA